MCKRVYLKAKEAEKEMQEVRKENGFVGKNEELLVSNMIKMARNNSRVGDKLLMVVDPMQIHIPDWQRRIKLERAYSIGNNYNSYKWDEPKVLLFGKRLWAIDGQHRIYGAFKAKKESVVVEVMECSLEDAIELFLSQSKDRAKMQPMDIYHAALAAKIVRALKSMYAYYEGRTEEMEEILVRKCKGTEFFVDNIMTKTQAQIFDFLSQIVKYEMENPFVMNKNTKKTKAKAKAV